MFQRLSDFSDGDRGSNPCISICFHDGIGCCRNLRRMEGVVCVHIHGPDGDLLTKDSLGSVRVV